MRYDNLADDEGEFYLESDGYEQNFVPRRTLWTEPYQQNSSHADQVSAQFDDLLQMLKQQTGTQRSFCSYDRTMLGGHDVIGFRERVSTMPGNLRLTWCIFGHPMVIALIIDW